MIQKFLDLSINLLNHDINIDIELLVNSLFPHIWEIALKVIVKFFLIFIHFLFVSFFQIKN